MAEYRGKEYLKRRLATKRTRVLTRYRYYEMKNSVQDFKTIIPENYKWLKETLGWCAKAVDCVADRLSFREFREDNFELNPIFQMNNSDVLFDSAMSKSQIGTAYVQIMPSMEGVAPKVKQYFGDSGTESSESFGSSLVGKIKSLIVTAGIGKVFSDAIMSGSDLEQSLGGVETLFKDSADIVIKNAEQAYKTAGMSANAYMETVTSFSASLLQGLSGDTEAAASIADMALTDMSDNANKMGTDMESIQNAYQGFAKQNYTMLDNLKLGYGGTKTEMERLLADAQKLTGIEYNIDNLADVYEAIHAIQTEMNISGLTAEEAAEMLAAGIMTEEEAFEALGTTAKEASTTISGSFNAMKAAAGDLMANLALGRDLEDSLAALTETAFTFLVDNLLPAVGNVLSGLPTVFSTASQR